MKKVNVFSESKLIATHWYPTEEEAIAAAFALHNHPLFKHRTVIEPTTGIIIYSADEEQK